MWEVYCLSGVRVDSGVILSILVIICTLISSVGGKDFQTSLCLLSRRRAEGWEEMERREEGEWVRK